MPTEIEIDYDPARVRGMIARRGSNSASSIWERIGARLAGNPDIRQLDGRLDMPWPEVLGLVREFGSAAMQSSLDFRFRPTDRARSPLQRFVAESRETRQARGKLALTI